ncbi:hypothetical protein DVH24_021650 [Malus domestica]|uniref:Uncharacterized protein n=1 Tax=Malus domestica TaxID=3750 RepID=A0A498JVD3_MALDO|nr:hypothetical protein DVH24_021650 [Malus domestica]
MMVPNPKPNKGFSSKVVDLIENGCTTLLSLHHYLVGNFAPVADETPPTTNLSVIGHLPECLNGEFVRVGPNPKFAPIAGYQQLDGDGDSQSISFFSSESDNGDKGRVNSGSSSEFRKKKPWLSPSSSSFTVLHVINRIRQRRRQRLAVCVRCIPRVQFSDRSAPEGSAPTASRWKAHTRDDEGNSKRVRDDEGNDAKKTKVEKSPEEERLEEKLGEEKELGSGQLGSEEFWVVGGDFRLLLQIPPLLAY